MARAVFDRFPDASEGRLAKIRAHVVSRASCAVVAKELGLGEQLAERAGDIAAGRAPADLPKPERARGAARGGARGPLSRARVRAHRGRRSSRHSASRSSTRGRATSTTRPSSRRPSRGRGARCTTRCSRSRGRRTTAGSSAPPTWPGRSSAWAGARRRRRPSRKPLGRRSRRSASCPTGSEAPAAGTRPGGRSRLCSLAPARLSAPSGAPRESRPVHLQTIRIRGFKSFPDALELTLEPGVAVIVGPNGSGKSNIADAVVWAAGSLTPSELRAEKPDDVLFAGGGDRKPARALRGRARVRQRGRHVARSSTSARCRSRAGSFEGRRGSTSSTALRSGARISSSCSQTSASARRCTRSSVRARSSRCSRRSRRTGERSSRRRPVSASSSVGVTAPSSGSRGSRSRSSALATSRTRCGSGCGRSPSRRRLPSGRRSCRARSPRCARGSRRSTSPPPESAEGRLKQRRDSAALVRRGAQGRLEGLLADRGRAEDELSDAAGRREGAVAALYRLQGGMERLALRAESAATLLERLRAWSTRRFPKRQAPTTRPISSARRSRPEDRP